MAIGVATAFALLSAVLSLVPGASDRPDTARLGLRGSLAVVSDTILPPPAPPTSRGAL